MAKSNYANEQGFGFTYWFLVGNKGIWSMGIA